MSNKSYDQDELDETELDPRIQIELEKLNTATDEINKLEIELDESNTTFRMLLNESTRRLQALSRKLGSCIERSRPYWDALEVAKVARVECQRAAVAYQRANEIHAAAKETVALAEQRFLSQDWKFDSAWQEMLNHATLKVTEAELKKAESGHEHRLRAATFRAAESRVQNLEEVQRRSIIKSRPYFEEKQLCQEQLNTQKQRIEELQKLVSKVKQEYSQSLSELEKISEEIHRRREMRRGPREPGVGAEKTSPIEETAQSKFLHQLDKGKIRYDIDNTTTFSLPDLDTELDCYDKRSLSSISVGTSSEKDEEEINESSDKLCQVRPVEGSSSNNWDELSVTVEKLNIMTTTLKDGTNQNAFYPGRSFIKPALRIFKI